MAGRPAARRTAELMDQFRSAPAEEVLKMTAGNATALYGLNP
jgi:hypothetical protein